MPRATNTINGKAFEYACLSAIFNKLRSQNKDVSIVESSAYNTAERAYESLSVSQKEKYNAAAETSVRLLFPLEPKIENGNGTLMLQIAADAVARGVDGDVRDVLCIRSDDGWTIGMSCKHNHEALRHPRITEGKDFGRDWIGISCSDDFMEEITPIIDSLVSCGQNNILWRTIDRKHDRYYVPILEAYLKEIRRLCETHEGVPGRLLSYFFGANDFYKVIMKESSRSTTVEGFNMNGTLNMPCGRTRAMMRVPVLRMPTRLLDAEFKQTRSGRSKTTIVLTFDNGWSISMRLHNKDKYARPISLAWDVVLEGLPPSVYVNTHSWDE